MPSFDKLVKVERLLTTQVGDGEIYRDGCLGYGCSVLAYSIIASAVPVSTFLAGDERSAPPPPGFVLILWEAGSLRMVIVAILDCI